MTNFIFCLIFIQVSIFLIAGVLLCASLIYGYFERKNSPAKAVIVRPRPGRETQYRQSSPLTRLEIEYLLNA